MRSRIALSAVIGLAMTSYGGFAADGSGQLPEVVETTDSPDAWEVEHGSAIAWVLGLTQIYQQNVHGGLSTSRRTGRYAGSYDVQASIDLEHALGLVDSAAYMLLEGGWPDTGSIDPAAVGSVFGVNGDAIEGEWIDVAELWYLRSLGDDRLFVQVGKADLTAGFEYRDVVSAFDLNRYANDEVSQFLNGALVNNPTIPFPAYSLAVSAVAKPRDNLQFAAAGASQTADSDIDETGSWVSDDEGLFFIFQGSLLPLPERTLGAGQGAYHVGGWWTGGGDLAAEDESRGAYLSASWWFPREDGRRDTERGLGVFGRYGWADGDTVDMEHFWNVGLQYQGLLDSRASDVLGLGFAQGEFADANPAAPEGRERVVELYYHMPVNSWLSVSPDVQYIADPGGETDTRDALVIGLRAQVVLE